MYEDYNVLFVDDEDNILTSLERGLIDEEYNCLFANSADRALQVMKEYDVSVIVSDMRMPGKDGLTLLKEVKEEYPKTVRVVLSGYTQLQQVLVTINQADIFKFITKPWKLESEFKLVIIQALNYHKLLCEREEYEIALEKRNISYQNILKKMEGIVSNTKSDFKSVTALTDKIFNTLILKLNPKLNPDINKRILETVKEFSKVAIEGLNESSGDCSNELILSILKELNKLKKIKKLESDSNLEDFKVNLPYHKVIISIIKTYVEIICSYGEKSIVKLTFQKDEKRGQLSVIIIVVNYISFNFEEEKRLYETTLDEIIEILYELTKHVKSMDKCIFGCARSEKKIILKYTLNYNKK
ncbi:MAG: response regulator [Clostridiales bacterium]